MAITIITRSGVADTNFRFIRLRRSHYCDTMRLELCQKCGKILKNAMRPLRSVRCRAYRNSKYKLNITVIVSACDRDVLSTVYGAVFRCALWVERCAR